MLVPQNIGFAKLAQLIKVPGELEFDPWDCSKGEKRKPTPQTCPLTFTQTYGFFGKPVS